MCQPLPPKTATETMTWAFNEIEDEYSLQLAPLAQLVQDNNEAGVKELLDSTPDEVTKGIWAGVFSNLYPRLVCNAMRDAVLLGNKNIVQIFLDKGVSPNIFAKDENEKSAHLCYFVLKVGNLEILKSLIAKGCNKAQVEKYNRSIISTLQTEHAELQDKLKNCQKEAILTKIKDLEARLHEVANYATCKELERQYSKDSHELYNQLSIKGFCSLNEEHRNLTQEAIWRLESLFKELPQMKADVEALRDRLEYIDANKAIIEAEVQALNAAIETVLKKIETCRQASHLLSPA